MVDDATEENLRDAALGVVLAYERFCRDGDYLRLASPIVSMRAVLWASGVSTPFLELLGGLDSLG